MSKSHFLMTIILITMASFALVACETMYGAGRDIEKAGDSVQDAATQ
jgi:entericidin B